jgi:sugar phosphate isomerase/epimerase
MTSILGNPMIFRDLTLEAALRTVAALGYDALELWPPQIAACKTDGLRRELAAYCAALGVPAVRLNAAGADYFDAPLTSPGAFVRALPGLKQHILAAEALGMHHLLTWEGRRPAGLAADTLHGDYLRAAVTIFRKAVAFGRDHGVALTIEVHPFTFGIDLDWLLRLFDGVGAHDFGLTYDCAHFGVGLPNDHLAAIARLSPHIHHVHFSDSDLATSELHLAPGRGRLDLPAIITALRSISYTGTWMLDLWGWPFPEEGSRSGLAYLRETLQSIR